MTKLSAPIDPFIAELNRYSVPFGAFVRSASGKREDDQFVASPSAAWERTFGGNAPSSDGKSTHSVGGGLRHADLAAMRTRACMRQPIDALRRMPDASEAARPPSAAFGPSCIPLQQRESSPESAPSSKATPTGGKSC